MHTRTFRLRPIAWCVMAACSGGAIANPSGPNVVAGSASFHANGDKLLVKNAPNTIINWNSFSIGGSEHTRFRQDSSASAVLNRVVGGDPSSILGRLSSNGRVFLINPHGIVFGAGSRIDTAGFIASTLNIADQDFLQGKFKFEGGGHGVLRNEGSIRARGDIMLVGPAIENAGLIRSEHGSVLLAAGRSVTITSPDAQGVKFELQAPTDSAINLGTIHAHNAASMLAGTLKHSGEIRATTASVEGGRVVLKAQDNTVVSGVIDASNSAGVGGRVEILGERVALETGARIDASGRDGGGTILVGGDFQGGNPGVQNAWKTVVASGTTLRADATDAGDGGKVILWADGQTRFGGEISARGGPNGGEGGFVEVSGKQHLAFRGTVDTRAPKGRQGTLLLDPTTVNIVEFNTLDADTDFSDFRYEEGRAAPPVSEITTAQLRGALSSADVIISTESSGIGAGDINFLVPFDYNGIVGDKRLFLVANRDVNIANPIFDSTPGGESLSLFLNTGGVTNITANLSLGSGVVDASRAGSRIVNFPTAGSEITAAALKAGVLNFNGGTVKVSADIVAEDINLTNGTLDVALGGLSRLDMSGGTLTRSTAGDLEIFGDFNLTGGTILNGFGNGDLITRGRTRVGTDTVAASVLVANDWRNLGVLDLDSGSLNLQNGVTFTNAFQIGGPSGVVNLNSTAANPFGAVAGATVVNEGVFNKNSAGLSTIAAAFTNVEGGELNVKAGNLLLTQGLAQGGIVEVGSGATLSTPGVSITNGPGATIGGSGTIDLAGATLVNEGRLRPGPLKEDVSGTLTIVGNLTTTEPTSRVEIELRGSPLSGNFDQLEVTGTATLGGTLRVSTPSDYRASPTDTFQIVRAGSLAGSAFSLLDKRFGNAGAESYDYALVGPQTVSMPIGLPTINTWLLPVSGDWSVGANWSLLHAPTLNERAVIVAPGETITVPISFSAQADDLTSNATLLVQGDLELRNRSSLGVVTLSGPVIPAELSGTGRVSATNLTVSNATVSSTGGITASGQITAGNIVVISGRVTGDSFDMLDGLLNITPTGTLTLVGNGAKVFGSLNPGTVLAEGLLRIGGQAGASALPVDVTVGSVGITNSGRLELDNVNLVPGDPGSGLTNTAGGIVSASRAVSIGLDTFSNAGGVLEAREASSIDYGSGANIFGNGTRMTGPGLHRVLTNSVLSGSIEASNLILVGGDIDGVATLSGNTAWVGGRILGDITIPELSSLALVGNAAKSVDGVAARLRNSGLMTIEGAGNAVLNGARIENSGRLDFTGAGTIDIAPSSQILNTATGFVRSTGSAAAPVTGGPVGGVFVNEGFFTKAAGSASTQTMNTAFLNQGDVTVAGGTLALPFAPAEVDTGHYTLRPGTVLDLTPAEFASNRVLGTDLSFSPDGTVKLTSGLLTTLSGMFPGLDLSGSAAVIRTNAGDIVVLGPFTVGTGGAFIGPGAAADDRFITEGTSTINATLGLSRHWTNTGTATLAAGQISPSGAVEVRNEGTLNINTADANPFAGTVSPLVNAGTINFSRAAAGPATISNILTNLAGANLRVLSGTLQLPGGITHNGVIFIARSATLATLGDGLVNPLGAMVSGGGTLDLGGGTLVSFGTLRPTSPTDLGPATLSILGNLTLNGSTIDGNGTVAVSGNTLLTGTGSTIESGLTADAYTQLAGLSVQRGGVLRLVGAAPKLISGGALNNSGSVFLTGTAATTLTDGALWQNFGTVTIGEGARIVIGEASFINRAAGDVFLTGSSATPIARSPGAATSVFANSGDVIKAAGSAATQTIDVPMTNTGLIDVDAGTLVATSFPSNSGIIDVAAGATFGTGGAPLVNNALGLLKGNGTIAANVTNNGTIGPGDSPGALTIGGNLVQGALGTIVIELGGTTPGTDYDQLRITGNATLDGTLVLLRTANSGIAEGSTFDIITYASATGDFSTFSVPPGATLNATAGATGYQIIAPKPIPSRLQDIPDPVVVAEIRRAQDPADLHRPLDRNVTNILQGPDNDPRRNDREAEECR